MKEKKNKGKQLLQAAACQPITQQTQQTVKTIYCNLNQSNLAAANYFNVIIGPATPFPYITSRSMMCLNALALQ